MPGIDARATVYAAAYRAALDGQRGMGISDEQARKKARAAVDDFIAHCAGR